MNTEMKRFFKDLRENKGFVAKNLSEAGEIGEIILDLLKGSARILEEEEEIENADCL